MAVTQRGSWTGHAGFVLAAAGSAIGLGNVWMFPFRTGQHGGAAFVLAYAVAVLAVGIPLMVAEILIGRSTRRNPVGAFRALGGGGAWQLVGWLGVLTGLVILSYYGVVAGWTVNYVLLSFSGGLFEGGEGSAGAVFEQLLSDVPRQIFWQAVFMVGTTVVVARGIEAGIERASKVLMPSLFVLVLILLGYSLNTDGAAQGLDFLLRPRFGELGWDGALAALGQAFFSLSLGMGAMITYGSYIDVQQSVARSALLIAAMDTVLALMAGLVIFPLVFTYGLEPSAGPGLVFITLPEAFRAMPASGFFAVTFFSLLMFAALTSAISLLEVVVSFVIDEFGFSRRAASWGCGGGIFALGLPSVLVPGFLDQMDAVANNWLLPGGGLLIAIFAGWVLKRPVAEAGYGGGRRIGLGFSVWRWCLRYVAPIAVGVILLQSTGALG
ncbi:MAG: NSS family neurotransmitter:Na+ symporter [Hyphomicrobiaceae bacterium]|jgi:NSS family neurotransmitter:Na+ symporter